MNPEDAKKLLGGYATDTLTSDERRRLFEAALSDQDLFDALAREQALKEALEAPGAREQLLRAARIGRERRASRWIPILRGPWPWAAAGAAALITILVVVLVRTEESARPQLAKVESAPAMKSAPVEPPRNEAYAPKVPLPRTVKRAAKPSVPRVQSAPAPPAPAAGEKEEALASPPPAQAPANGAAVAGALSETRQPMMATRSAGGFTPMASVAQPGLQVSVARVPEADMPRARRTFHAGDSIQLRITPPFEGRLYVLRTEDSGANWTLAYSADARANVAAMAPLRLDMPGHTWFIVVLSRSPLAELAAAPPDKNLIDRVRRDAGDLALAKPATASVNVPARASRLVREIRLTVEP